MNVKRSVPSRALPAGDGPGGPSVPSVPTQAPATAGWQVAAVAHDLKNLLTVCLGCSGVLRRHVAPGTAAWTAAQEIERASLWATDLVQQLLRPGQPPPPKMARLDLNALVAEVERMLRPLLPANIHCLTALEPGAKVVRGDASQLAQVLLNLAFNARDAMPEGGQLWIATTRLSGTRLPEGLSPAPGGHWIGLTVSDTGTGMDEETQAHLFEPFRTTKPDGHGLGLGTVLDVVRSHGGLIRVTSRLGSGTTVALFLPEAEGGEPVPSPEDEPAALLVPVRGRETILLVEDHDAVRSLAADALRRGGYTVLSARHGKEAVHIARAGVTPIDLLLSDVIMPEMGGDELAKVLRRSRPGLKVLFTSGLMTPEQAAEEPRLKGGEFLAKPFRTDDLLCAVRRALDRRPG